MRVVLPGRDELPHLRTALTDGEWTVFKFFDSLLPEEWEIYVQPHLNGLRPDFVLLHPEVGIAVFEVKDWDLSALRYHVRPREDKPPELIAIDSNGKTFSLQYENPIERVHGYKNEIYELYCPRLKQRAGLSAITVGVIFTRAEKQTACELFCPCYEYRKMNDAPRYHPVSGTDDLESKALSAVFPESQRRYSIQMNDMLAKDLRN